MILNLDSFVKYGIGIYRSSPKRSVILGVYANTIFHEVIKIE